MEHKSDSGVGAEEEQRTSTPLNPLSKKRPKASFAGSDSISELRDKLNFHLRSCDSAVRRFIQQQELVKYMPTHGKTAKCIENVFSVSTNSCVQRAMLNVVLPGLKAAMSARDANELPLKRQKKLVPVEQDTEWTAEDLENISQLDDDFIMKLKEADSSAAETLETVLAILCSKVPEGPPMKIGSTVEDRDGRQAADIEGDSGRAKIQETASAVISPNSSTLPGSATSLVKRVSQGGNGECEMNKPVLPADDGFLGMNCYPILREYLPSEVDMQHGALTVKVGEMCTLLQMPESERDNVWQYVQRNVTNEIGYVLKKCFELE